MTGNTGFIHPGCADERKQRWQDENRDLVICPGDFVKLVFDEGLHTEHMWVQITAVFGDRMTGRINNDPIHLTVKLGDVVEFHRLHIEDQIKGAL